MQPRQLAGNGQAEPDAAESAGDAGIALDEGLEDPFQLMPLHPDSGIGEAEFEICKVAALCHRGLSGTQAGQLGGGPQGIAVDQVTGSVYVSDQANNRVDIFSATGVFEGAFGWGVRAGDGESTGFDFCTTATGCQAGVGGASAGQFESEIGGLGFDATGDLYVADEANRRIDVFEPILSGNVVIGIEFVHAFGWGVDTEANAFEVCTTVSTCNAGTTQGSGNQAGQFGTGSPSDVTVNSKGDVFALDALFERIQEFSSAPAVLSSEFGNTALAEVFGTGGGLNIAMMGDHLYVSGIRSTSGNKVAVAELDQKGQSVDLHGVDLTATNTSGLAVATAVLGGNIYVSVPGSPVSGIYILNDKPSMEPVVVHAGTTATFSGAVVSNGISTTYHFEYSSDGEHWSSFPASDTSAGTSTANAQIISTGTGTGELNVVASGGTFTLSFNAESTSTIPYNASAVSVQSALEDLASVGAGNVTVGGGPGGSTPYTITFTGVLSGTEVTQISSDPTDLDAPLIPVTEDATGLTGSQLYQVRLVQNRISGGGRAASNPVSFKTDPAAPAISATHASRPTDTNVSLNATLNPQNEEVSYHFEYVDSATFAESAFSNATITPVPDATAGPSGALMISKDVSALEPDTEYHFRMVAANETGSTIGEEATFTTYPSQEVNQNCVNSQFRIGASARLPDCRAYELVSPVDSNGLFPVSKIGEGGPETAFDTTMAATDGSSVIFDAVGTLPGDEANGTRAAYEASRQNEGWFTQGISPSGAQAVTPGIGGVSPDHKYAFWQSKSGGGTLMVEGQDAHYIRNPSGSFDLIGQGGLGTDPKVRGRWITAGADHVIFNTQAGIAVPLETGAPPAGIAAIYDRTPDSVTHVVSLPPTGASTATQLEFESENAEYRGVSTDGTGIVFSVGSIMYERLDNATTLPIVEGEAVFAGVSADGGRVFYMQGGDAFACDVDSVGCGPGGNAPVSVGSGGETTLINISADGSHVFFVSPKQLDGGLGEIGANNLYVWSGSSVRFITELDPADFEAFGSGAVRLGRWTELLNQELTVSTGPADNPSRTTSDGNFFVFQSHANLTSYDSSGHSEIYRYDTSSNSLTCVSCNPHGDAAMSNAELEANTQLNSPVNALTHISNITDSGETVFFQTSDALVPADVNGVQDVYEWRAGRLFLISSGHSAARSYLYAMTTDGHDVFFATNEALVPEDQNGGSVRIYDARVDGGFPVGSGGEGCLEDACQAQSDAAPSLPDVGSAVFQGPGNVKPHHRHRRHRHRKRHHRRHHHRPSNTHGGRK